MPTRGRTKYERLYVALAAGIRAGTFAPGARFPSQRALMQRHGVSLATVSAAFEALSRDGLIETRHGSGTFVCGEPSRRPAGTRGVTFGLFLQRMVADPGGVLKGVYEASLAAGIHLEFLLYDGEASRRRRCREVLDGTVVVDGCLMMHVPGYDDVIDELRARAFPYVVMDAPCRYEKLDQILLDHELAAADAVRHLADHGHTRVALVSGAFRSAKIGDDWTRAKARGYLAAVKERGLARDRELCVELPDLEPENAIAAGRSLAAQKDLGAVFIAAGSVATDVIDGLREAGRGVPDDVAVTSFNVNEYDRMADAAYAVSGMDVPRVGCGRAAVELLARIVGGAAGPAPHVAELAIPLVRRRSCGCA